MEHQQGEIQIYVACMAAYNADHLHGQWINAEQSVDEINAAIQAMLRASPIEEAEEFAIHDYEGFEGLEISEYEGVAGVVEKVAFISEHGELGAQLAGYYGDMQHAISALNDHYAGQYESVEDFAREITEDTTQIPQNLAFNIDYERMARDLEINDVTAIELSHGEVHIFWTH